MGCGISMTPRLPTGALRGGAACLLGRATRLLRRRRGTASSATRRGGSRLESTKGRTAPLASTWRAFVGAGSPMALSGM